MKKQTCKKVTSLVLSFLLTFSMLSVFTSVSAAEDFAISINFISETLVIAGESFNKDNDTPIYMYSPGVSLTSNDKKQASEKWYPIYGNSIELGKYVPKSPEKDYVIAVRRADDIQSESGTYSSRKTIIVRGRPKFTASDFKNKVEYDARSSTILVSADLKNIGYDYKVGISDWILGKTENLYVDPVSNYLGGFIVVRQSATAVSFASLPYKVKIPKAAAMPKIKVNENAKKIIGIGKNQAWAMRIDADYYNLTDSSFDLKDIAIKTTSLSNLQVETRIVNDVAQQYYVMYFKTMATDKSPSSPIQKVYINKAICDAAVSQGASNTVPTT